MLKIAVCDDEGVFLAEMTLKLNKLLPGCEIKTYLSGEALLNDSEPSDIYFLDIKMGGLSGMETARRLREKNDDAVIVFLTWEKSYVFEAFDVDAFHYLLKPVDDEKLSGVLQRAQDELEKRRSRTGKTILVKINGRSIALKLSDVVYFESDVRRIVAHTKNEDVTYYGTMSELEKEAGEGFFRCHRAYIVNLSCVSEYDAETVMLSNGDRAIMARGRYADFVKQYMRFLRGGVMTDA